LGDQTYRVVAGDSLWRIAKHKLGAGHRWPEIYAMNRKIITDPDLIHPGQVFALPPRDRYGIPDPHPLQRSRPHVAVLTTPASPQNATAIPQTPSRPSASSSNPLSGLPRAIAETTVNNIAIKIELNVVPEVRMPIPMGEVKISWTGTMYFWKDGTRPLTTVGNRGLEISEKKEISSALPHFLESKKLSVGLDGKVTYEDLLGQMSYGSPSSIISSGIAITATEPSLTYRTQAKITGRAGKIGNWLFYSPETRINFDITIKPQPPRSSPGAQLVPSFVPQLVPAPIPASPAIPSRIATNPAPGSASPGPSRLQELGHWTSEHKEQIALALFLGASVVLGVLTLGASVPVEAAAAGVVGIGAAGVGVAAMRSNQARTGVPGA
jgi:hypothetical protein